MIFLVELDNEQGALIAGYDFSGDDEIRAQTRALMTAIVASYEHTED